METQKINDIEKDIVVLQQEVKQYAILLTKLDEAISKISDVSNNVARLLTLHEERIAKQAERIEDNRIDAKGEFEEVHEKIVKMDKTIDELIKMKYVLMGAWTIISVLVARAFGFEFGHH